ncbi:MAG TPA: helix-turn-helix domain-containing protein [Candidatus Scybalocola faecavium]|nr:helix-turn-helix domain-containing protein [Candidatus Scybalocola faecavium]
MSIFISPAKASEMLMMALSKNKGPGPMVCLAETIMGNPVAVSDMSLTVLYASDTMPVSNSRRSPVKNVQSVTTRLKVHGQMVGYLIVLPLNHSLGESDMEKLSLVRRAMETELGKNTSVLFTPPSPGETTLKNLLSGQENPLQNNADLTISLGINKNARLYVIVFQIPGSGADTLPLMTIRQELSRLCQARLTVIFDNSIVCLRQGELFREPVLDPPPRPLLDYLKKYAIIGGISTCFFQVRDLGRHYSQAVDTIRYFKGKKGWGLYRYESAAVFIYLERHKNAGLGQKYCHPGAIALSRYDRDHRTDYTGILKIYTESGKNAQVTASKAGVSKATIYRILDRIRHITGQNMETPQSLFNLYFSIMLMEAQGGYDA